jgi:hypothetical protein
MGYISKGGTGFRVERFKFLLYLIAPIGAVYVYSLPAVHEAALTNVRASARVRVGACLSGMEEVHLAGGEAAFVGRHHLAAALRVGARPTDIIYHRQIE